MFISWQYSLFFYALSMIAQCYWKINIMGHRTSLTDKSCKLWKIFQMTKNVSKNILFVLYLNTSVGWKPNFRHGGSIGWIVDSFRNRDRPCGTDSGKTILNRPGRISMTSDKNLFLQYNNVSSRILRSTLNDSSESLYPRGV